MPSDVDPDPDPWDEFASADHPLDRYLGGALKGHGSAFEDAGAKHGVDPTLLAAIATLESGHGTSRVTTAYNNPTGMMDPKDPKNFQRFESIPDAIDATARDLSENYLKQGLGTIAQIGAKYSPPTDEKGRRTANDVYGTNAQWPSQVQQIYQKMGGNRIQFGPQLVGPAVAIMAGEEPPPDRRIAQR
jgi:beta-N-acetylglucosaminidase